MKNAVLIQPASTRADRFNAHLTLNILNTIQGCIMDHETDQAIQLISDYSNILKETLIKPHQTTSIEKELELIKQFNRIEEIRFDRKQKVMIKVPPQLLSEKLPKSILFGLFENATKHGLRNLNGNGYISIYGSLSPQRFIQIENIAPESLNGFDQGNGLTLAKEQIEEYNENFHTELKLSYHHEQVDGGLQKVIVSLSF